MGSGARRCRSTRNQTHRRLTRTGRATRHLTKGACPCRRLRRVGTGHRSRVIIRASPWLCLLPPTLTISSSSSSLTRARSSPSCRAACLNRAAIRLNCRQTQTPCPHQVTVGFLGGRARCLACRQVGSKGIVTGREGRRYFHLASMF